jgi:hypothetical protein
MFFTKNHKNSATELDFFSAKTKTSKENCVFRKNDTKILFHIHIHILQFQRKILCLRSSN